MKARPLLAAIGAPVEEPAPRVTLLAVAVGGRGLVDPDEPILHADDEAFLRGRAAFETTRVYGGRPFKLDEHLARLAGSAARIGLRRSTPSELRRLARRARRGGRAGRRAPPLLDAGPRGRRRPTRSRW